MTREIDVELLKLIEEIRCLCGIPGCAGHEDLGGFIVLEASKLPILSKDEADESKMVDRRAESPDSPCPPSIW